MSRLQQGKSLLVKNARVVDPYSNTDKKLDVLIEGKHIKKVETNIKVDGNLNIIEAGDFILTPSFIDLHTHIREPGREDEETIESAMAAAHTGGYTAITAMPNTEPPIDNDSLVRYVLSKAVGLPVALYVAGAITKGIKGQELAEMGEMAQAGAVFFTDDGNCVQSAAVMRKAMEYAKGLGKMLFLHCEDKSLTDGSQINESQASTKLGLKGWPAVAESIIVDRDIRLSELTGCSVHFTHISCKGSVELIRAAKKKGLPVTCDTTPHHITLTEEELTGYDTNFKVNPPLRSEEDRLSLIVGIKDGTIDAIATDHAPHAEHEKECEFEYAAFGMTGLETALSVSLSSLLVAGKMSLMDIITKFTSGPAKILGLENSGIKEGAVANLALIDLGMKWIYSPEQTCSKSKNSPFIGRELTGKVVRTIYEGDTVYGEVR